MRSIENGIKTRRTPLRVVVIGGGFSGTLVAIHLLRQSSSLEIDIVEERLPGRGLAYSTNCAEHLLNVPAIRMSAFGSEPLHFLNWLHSHGVPSANPDLFAPRRVYGTYLQDLLETTARSAGPDARLQHHFSAVQKISFDGRSRQVFLRNGLCLKADRIVLALGNPASRSLPAPPPGYYSSPWQPEALSGLPPEKEVLLLGAGLTAVDAFIALISQGHSGPIHMLSRRGQIPQFHEPYRPLAGSFPIPENVSARTLLKAIRAEVKKAQLQGVNWRAVVDSLRPVTNEIWQQLDEKEQVRFFRHGKTWWDIHRHRMASEIGAKVHDALERKQLIVHAGRLRKLTPAESGLRAEIQPRGGVQASLQVEKVVNCTGPDNDYRSTEDPLIRCILDRGYGTPGRTGRGFRATADGEMMGVGDLTMDWLLTLGPPRLGDLLETIAVPELRRQAESLANHLLSVDREPIEVEPEVFMAAGI